MGFNNGKERRKLNEEWKRLSIQYRKAGMSEEAIQAMYEFDLKTFNSERSYISNTVKIVGDGSEETEAVRRKFEKVSRVEDTYHETRTKFAWVGEIQDERLSSGLENLSEEDLQLLTLYFVEGYTLDEISKFYMVSHQCISKRISKITNHLKKI